jgi:hypothetical protein
VRCGRAFSNLIVGTFLESSYAPHPLAIPRPFIDQIQNIPALSPEPFPFAAPTSSVCNRYRSRSALLPMWSLVGGHHRVTADRGRAFPPVTCKICGSMRE